MMFFSRSMPETLTHLTAAEELVFREPDKAIESVLVVVVQAIQDLDQKLNNPSILESEKSHLIIRRDKIVNELETLQKLRGNF